MNAEFFSRMAPADPDDDKAFACSTDLLELPPSPRFSDEAEDVHHPTEVVYDDRETYGY